MGYFNCCCFKFKVILFTVVSFCIIFQETSGGIGNILDVRYWSCLLKKTYSCPDNDIKFYLYTHDTGHLRKRIDVRSKFALDAAGWDPHKNNVIIIHGYNGTHTAPAMKLLRNAFLSRHYNVFMVNWHPLTRFPCYLSSLSNMKLVSQCIAQLYAYIMDKGGLSKKTMCVGHSLGAHICGMITNYLDVKQYRIVGLDPARPLIDAFSNQQFRLTRDDAYQVQVVHTNAGLLGETGLVGHVDFCVNGGQSQPGCYGHLIRRQRCSHTQSVCYFAQAIRDNQPFHGRPCSSSCPKKFSWNEVPGGKLLAMGPDVPITAKGMYCIKFEHDKDCAFN